MIDATLLEAFENRVRKRYRHLRKWAQRERCNAFRVYDRDIPEMAYAFDVYGDRALLQQYLRGPEIPAEPEVLAEVAAAAARATERAPEAVTLKVRRKLDRREMQHQPTGWEGADFVVEEHGLKFVVNLEGYLDTGLFLDHRPTRAIVRARAAGRRFLNLFCYTGSFTVHAAAGGAAGSISVDLSNTYLAWARRNLELNGFDVARHQLERADVREWLREARGRGERFGLIVLDPPAYSSSKRMNGVFDVQRDHGALLAETAALLEPGGELYFSTNLRGFRLDSGACAGLAVEDITARTIPEDFRNLRIHQCWRMVRPATA